MNAPYVSLTMTRQHVTELVRSPRATAALGPFQKQAPRSVSPHVPEAAAPSTPVAAVRLPAAIAMMKSSAISIVASALVP